MGLNDGVVVYRARKAKQFRLALLCLAFVAISLTLMNGASAWFVGLFFTLCMVVSLVQMLPNASYLRLTAEGFEIRSMFRSGFTRWDQIAEIGVTRDSVAFIFTEEAAGERLRRVLYELQGSEGILPDTYGHSPNGLAELMWEWKLRHSRPS